MPKQTVFENLGDGFFRCSGKIFDRADIKVLTDLRESDITIPHRQGNSLFGVHVKVGNATTKRLQEATLSEPFCKRIKYLKGKKAKKLYISLSGC